MNDQHQEHLVRTALGRYLDRDPKTLHGSDRLEHDLGMTTLDLVLVALHLEDVMSIELPIEKIEDVRTVADLTRFLHACVREQRAVVSESVPRAPISEIRSLADDDDVVPLGFGRAFARSSA